MDTGLVCLAIVARFHGRAANPDQLRHELALSAPADADSLTKAARLLDLKAKVGPVNLARAAEGKAPLPCVLEMRSGAFCVLAKVEGGKALVHDPAAGRASAIPVEELTRETTGKALFIASRATLAADLARFDFTWFVPAIVKYGVSSARRYSRLWRSRYSHSLRRFSSRSWSTRYWSIRGCPP